MLLRALFFLFLFINFNSSKIYAKEIPIIVISAGKSIQSIATVGSDIEVIDAETIEKSEHNFLGDIINENITGANYFQSGGHGTTAGMQLRGLPKRYSTVYIDGVKMSDPSSPDTSFYIQNIMKDSIERVEILKGSQSSLYGSNAIGGTINIFTKKGKKGNNYEHDITLGSNRTGNLNASFDTASKDYDFYIGFNSFSTDGISAMSNDTPNTNKIKSDDDSYVNKSLVTNYGYKINDSIDFRGSLRLNDSLLNYDEVQIGRTDINNKTDDTEFSYNLRLNHTDDKFKNSLIYNYTEIERRTKSYTDTRKNYYGYRDAFNFIGEYNYNLDTKIVYGLDNEFDSAKFKKDWPTDYLTAGESIHSQYVDLQLRHSDKLYQTIGFRRDDHSIAGAYDTYRSTLAYKLNSSSKIRTSYGTGIRFPSLYDYYYGSTVNIKETLKAEKSKSFDVGYDTYLDEINTSFDISLYNITYKDAIEGWESHGWVVKNSTAEIKSKGIEISSLWKPINNFNIGLNYSYTDTYDGADCDNPSQGSQYTVVSIDCAMVRVPRHAITSAINYKSKNNINNKLLIKYVGERKDYGNTNNSFADVILDEYITFDYLADYNLNNKYKIYLSAVNLFDENYEQAYQYSTMGISFNIGIKTKY
jgi:vitamin B12 transporter